MGSVKTRKYNCGWSLTHEERAAIIMRLQAWTPKSEKEKRDRHICELAFIQNMNASQIARIENDALLYGMGNRNRGRLGRAGIGLILHKYAPEINRPRGYSRKTNATRTELFNRRKKGEIIKPHICAACGSIENLELHHIIPLAAGGTNDNFNLIYLCFDCHRELHREIYKKVVFRNS